MPMKIAHHAINVHRDGRTVRVPPGIPFDFTEDEVTSVTTTHPRALRNPVNEVNADMVKENADRMRDAGTDAPNDERPTPADVVQASRTTTGRVAPRKTISPVTNNETDEEL